MLDVQHTSLLEPEPLGITHSSLLESEVSGVSDISGFLWLKMLATTHIFLLLEPEGFRVFMQQQKMFVEMYGEP